MRLISNKALRDFARTHPAAQASLQGWRRIIEQGRFRNFSELKRAFNAVDKAGNYFVFNIAGNKYRIVTWINYPYRVVYVRFIGTHARYDRIDAQTI